MTSKINDDPESDNIQIHEPRVIDIDLDEPEKVGERELEFIATKPSDDREGDTIEPLGMDVEPFKKNPVYLWSHNRGMLPIGRVTKIETGEGGILANVKFKEDKFSEQVFQDYLNGFLNAVSVGFKPKNMEEKENGGIRFLTTELLELSAVTVPAHREALIQRELNKRGFYSGYTKSIEGNFEANPMSSKEDVASKLLKAVSDALGVQSEEVIKLAEASKEAGIDPSDEKRDAEPVTKAVTEYRDYPLVEAESWDGDQAESEIREWASNDGSGDKDTIDWEAYRNGHLLYDGAVDLSSNDVDFSDFKMPYVRIKGGDPVVPDAVIRVINSVLEGGMGGVEEFDEGDIEDAKEHWSNYNEKAGQTAPWDEGEEGSVDEESLKESDETVEAESPDEFEEIEDSFTDGDQRPGVDEIQDEESVELVYEDTSEDWEEVELTI